MFDGKMKVVTFSYDDGVTQDIRLIEILDKYGLKCTFNLNSELLGRKNELIREGVTVKHEKNAPEKISQIYKNHEVAVHTLTHPTLTELEEEEIVRQVEEDRIALSKLCGYEVVGMAYPNGPNDDRTAGIIRRRTGVKYARTTKPTHNFDIQENLYRFNPTVHQHGEFDKTFELAEKFVALKAESPQILYIWGHAYELDIRDEWNRFEDLCRMLSGRNDIFYGTNKEVLLAGK